MSVAPDIQKLLLDPGVPRETGIDRPIAPEVIARETRAFLYEGKLGNLDLPATSL